MEAAADDVRDEVALVLCLAATAIAAGCGSPSDSTVEQQVAKTMAATSGHAVSKVSCTKGIADPPAGTPPSTAADRTCRISFSDGTKPQVWAVRVADFSVTSAVEPLYRLDQATADTSTEAALRTSAAAAFATVSGKRVLSVRCTVAAGLKAGGDHRCRAVFADHSHSVWAVRGVPPALGCCTRSVDPARYLLPSLACHRASMSNSTFSTTS